MEKSGPVSAVKSLRGARVLVVEDDAILLIELETILRDAGAEMIAACRTVGEALAAANKNGLKAAILDVRIGRETISPVARHLAARGTPFLFYTGQVSSDPALMEWPGCRIVAKPAQAKAIVTAVAELLR
jgi:DNA-binding NtrC family response regulator